MSEVYVDGAEFVFSATIHEDVVEVARCKSTERAQYVIYHPVKGSRCVLQALGHYEPLLEHAAGSADGREGGVAFPHHDLIEAVCQIDRTVDDAARHGVEDHVLPAICLPLV
ncbi:unnamed protein product [Phytophthora fragariaefolia]|uniref:Unnamed protein product n=1 Tax=Phytophthora fragariaefolia TaxID=1490495 RepID=A0A9W6YAR8_9STRA|nr:unnamed protein product [Phytophthora fragariaefolia]